MFYRATPKAHGTGLGLYIVKLMVEKLQGKIQVNSERGKGTMFHLELPNRLLKKSPPVL
jgi:signal transduction histidine kinase